MFALYTFIVGLKSEYFTLYIMQKKSDEMETKGEKNKNNKDDSSDTSDDDNQVNKLGGGGGET